MLSYSLVYIPCYHIVKFISQFISYRFEDKHLAFIESRLFFFGQQRCGRTSMRPRPEVPTKDSALWHEEEARMDQIKIPEYGKITFFYGKITIFYGKITIFYGKITIFYGKSPFLMGKSTISMAMFNSYVKLLVLDMMNIDEH